MNKSAEDAVLYVYRRRYQPLGDLAPFTVIGNVNEMEWVNYEGTELAQQWRNPITILADGMIGQMMEPVRLPEFKPVPKPNEIAGIRDWACTGYSDRGGDQNRRVVKSLRMKPEDLEAHVEKLFEKYARAEKELCRYETENLKGAEVVLVAFGTTARICREACEVLAEQGVKAGLIRPISLWPFPNKAFDEIDFGATKAVVSVELSMGQMLQDINLGVKGRVPVKLIHRVGGMLPTSLEVVEKTKKILEEVR